LTSNRKSKPQIREFFPQAFDERLTDLVLLIKICIN
jgi:hypothetical protein